MIGKTKDNIIIRSTYYELKLNKDDLSLLTKTIYKSIDESYEFIKNIFNQNKFKIKEKTSKRIKLIIRIYDMIKAKEKDIELILLENFENQNSLIKDLFNKYINIEKKIDEINNDNKILKEENDRLKQDNNNLKMEIQFIKNNNENKFGGLQMQYMNIMNTINMIQQQINQFINRINQMEQTMNMMSNNNLNLMSQNNFNLQNFNPMNNEYNLNNNLNGMNQNNFNLMNLSNNDSDLIDQNNPMFKFMNETRNDYNNQYINIIFRFSGPNKRKLPIIVQCKYDDLISTIIEKFRKKTNIFNEHVKFYFNQE